MNPDWNKTVIMGQQIAGDDALFAGAGVPAQRKLSTCRLTTDMDQTGALDMDFGGDRRSGSGRID